MENAEDFTWRGDKSMLCILVEIIVGQAWFLESCDDETLDLQIAVQQLEDIGGGLQQLTSTEKSEIKTCLETLVVEAETRQEHAYPFYAVDPRYIEFLRSFFHDSGLEDEDDEEDEEGKEDVC